MRSVRLSLAYTHTHPLPLSLSPFHTTLVVQGRIVVDSKRLEVATHKMMAFPTMKAWLISKVRISLHARPLLRVRERDEHRWYFWQGYLKIAHTPQPQWSTILRNEYHRLYQYYLKEKRVVHSVKTALAHAHAHSNVCTKFLSARV